MELKTYLLAKLECYEEYPNRNSLNQILDMATHLGILEQTKKFLIAKENNDSKYIQEFLNSLKAKKVNKPPYIFINPEEWVIPRKAARILGIDREILKYWTNDRKIKSILYLDGNTFYNIRELNTIRFKIEHQIAPFDKITFTSQARETGLPLEPSLDFFTKITSEKKD